MAHKKTFAKKVAEFMIGEIITAGLALIMIVYGFSYFNMQYAWTELVNMLAKETGTGADLIREIGFLASKMSTVFPFNLIYSGESYSNLMLLGVFLSLIGLILLIAISPSKDHFWKDLGKELIIPGIIGLLVVLFIQVLAIVSFYQLAQLSSLKEVLAAAESSKVFSSGQALFGAYSDILVMGIYFVVFGSIIYTILNARKIRAAILRMVSRTALYSGFVFIGYYAFLRLIIVKFIADSAFGPILKVFAVTSSMSHTTFMISIVMIILGMEMRKYARWLHAHHVHGTIVS